MELIKNRNKKNKGGRPKVAVKRDEALTVMCNLEEKKNIMENAKISNVPVSVFLRELGLKGRVKTKIKTLPREVLQITGTLNHLAANINQIARKRNKGESLNAIDRALLNKEVRELQTVVKEIKTAIK
jgi:hypothetical protein